MVTFDRTYPETAERRSREGQSGGIQNAGFSGRQITHHTLEGRRLSLARDKLQVK